MQTVLGPLFCRQEPEEHGLFKLYQSWEERSEEHLTLKQEEGEHLHHCPADTLSQHSKQCPQWGVNCTWPRTQKKGWATSLTPSHSLEAA